MEATTKPTQKKQKTDSNFYRDLFQDIGTILDELETDEANMKQDSVDKSLVAASFLYKDILDDHIFDAKIRLALSKFMKRAKRRATRKPLTIRKAQSLAEDLHQLATIFKI